MKKAYTIMLIIVFVGLDTQVQAFNEASEKETENDQIVVIPNRGSTSELRIRGRFQGQFAHSAGSNADESALGQAGDYNSFEIRRLRLGVQGKLLGNWEYMAEANILSTANLDAAYVRYTALHELNVSIEKAKPVFGHEQYTSSASILTFERSVLDGHLNASKPIGLRIFGEKSVVSYSAGVYNGQNTGTGRMATNMNSYLWNASLGVDVQQMLPEGVSVELRGDYIHSNDSGGYYDFEHAYAFSIHAEVHRLDLRTEYMIGHGFSDNTNVDGFYIMPSYFLTPKKWQAVMRYENVTADSGVSLGHNRYAAEVPGIYLSGDEYQALYAGLNYYIQAHNMKLMLGYEWAENVLHDTNLSSNTSAFFAGLRMQI